MKNQDFYALSELASGVGDFIRYWGFRKIHGQIWTLVYLSEKPLSGIEIIKILNVSKALVSPALKELESEKLILEIKSENAKVKRYVAVDDVGAVIGKVLEKREKPMMNQISEALQKLKKNEVSEIKDFLNSKRLKEIDQMIGTAQMGLALLLAKNTFWK